MATQKLLQSSGAAVVVSAEIEAKLAIVASKNPGILQLIAGIVDGAMEASGAVAASPGQQGFPDHRHLALVQ